MQEIQENVVTCHWQILLLNVTQYGGNAVTVADGMAPPAWH